MTKCRRAFIEAPPCVVACRRHAHTKQPRCGARRYSMTSSPERRTQPRALGTAASLLVSRELRWLYYVAFWFMLVAGTALLIVGALIFGRALLSGELYE